MIHTPHKTSVKDPGERWRRYLERVGTRSNDFAARLSRARFVYLHRRETFNCQIGHGAYVNVALSSPIRDPAPIHDSRFLIHD